MTDKILAEFEAWAKKCNKANKIDHMYLNMTENKSFYLDNRTELAWQAWQASRAALVVQLPVTVCRTHVFEIPHTNEVGMEHDEYFEVDDVQKALTAAGVAYK